MRSTARAWCRRVQSAGVVMGLLRPKELPGFFKADIPASILKQNLNVYRNNVSMLFYFVEGASHHK